MPPAAPGKPGASTPPPSIVTDEMMTPVPASVPLLLTVMPAAVSWPLSTTVPDVTFAAWKPEKLLA